MEFCNNSTSMGDLQSRVSQSDEQLSSKAVQGNDNSKKQYGGVCRGSKAAKTEAAAGPQPASAAAPSTRASSKTADASSGRHSPDFSTKVKSLHETPLADLEFF